MLHKNKKKTGQKASDHWIDHRIAMYRYLERDQDGNDDIYVPSILWWRKTQTPVISMGGALGLPPVRYWPGQSGFRHSCPVSCGQMCSSSLSHSQWMGWHALRRSRNWTFTFLLTARCSAMHVVLLHIVLQGALGYHEEWIAPLCTITSRASCCNNMHRNVRIPTTYNVNRASVTNLLHYCSVANHQYIYWQFVKVIVFFLQLPVNISGW